MANSLAGWSMDRYHVLGQVSHAPFTVNRSRLPKSHPDVRQSIEMIARGASCRVHHILELTHHSHRLCGSGPRRQVRTVASCAPISVRLPNDISRFLPQT